MGLGNAGEKFFRTRHNIGALFVHFLLKEFNTNLSFHRCGAGVARVSFKENELLLVEPQTFMNVCGKVVQCILDTFSIPPQNTIIVHDDCDIPFGKIKIKRGGGSGGHKGIDSIIESIGEDFLRLRMGIGRGNKPLHEYVLEEFPQDEWGSLPSFFLLGKEAIFSIIEKGEGFAMTKYNR